MISSTCIRHKSIFANGNNIWKLDKLTPVNFSDYLASKIKKQKGYVVEGGDHFMQLQLYKEVNGRIERFLKRVK
ncbi:MAG: hypothetical protein CM1200mP35_04770 [Chloroflexota bacterium]|nr:MAG: hypothetical protein CM1200mP35_04770 [Chloroflexota bacterium]